MIIMRITAIIRKASTTVVAGRKTSETSASKGVRRNGEPAMAVMVIPPMATMPTTVTIVTATRNQRSAMSQRCTPMRRSAHGRRRTRGRRRIALIARLTLINLIALGRPSRTRRTRPSGPRPRGRHRTERGRSLMPPSVPRTRRRGVSGAHARRI